MRALALLLATLTACSVSSVRRDTVLKEVGLFVPDAIGDEAPATRVIVLHRSGRTTVMDDATIRRDGDVFRLAKAKSPTLGVDIAYADVQAVEIERRAIGPTAEVLGEHAVSRGGTVTGSDSSLIGGLLIGALTVTLVVLVAVAEEE